MPDPVDPTPPGGFDVLAAVVPVLVGLMFVVIVGTMVYRGLRMARRGVNPLTLQEDLAARALRSGALAPARSKGDRLAELDLLRGGGRISDAEHAAARARILAE